MSMEASANTPPTGVQEGSDFDATCIGDDVTPPDGCRMESLVNPDRNIDFGLILFVGAWRETPRKHGGSSSSKWCRWQAGKR